MNQEFFTFLTTVAAASLATGGVVWAFFGWISGKLSVIYTKIEESQKAILAKLEYHERHDDQRFTTINNELWAIKVRNASKDGHLPQANINAS